MNTFPKFGVKNKQNMCKHLVESLLALELFTKTLVEPSEVSGNKKKNNVKNCGGLGSFTLLYIELFCQWGLSHFGYSRPP